MHAKPDFEDEADVGKKKKYSKKGNNVPYDALGFQAKMAYDVIDPRNMPRIVRRRKPKYTQQNSKQNFLSRLRMIIDVNDLPQDTLSTQFRVNKLSEWTWVKKVHYRSREKVFCSICLDEQIIAPQITFCGHIFCFHCILMHFTKSPNSTVCPVCKQFTQETEVKTCEPHCEEQLTISDQICFSLKFRVGKTIYDSETLTQDLNFEQIIRMRSKGILIIFEKQLEQLRAQLLKTPQTHRNHFYLEKAIKICQQKIQKAQKIFESHPQHIKLRENEKIRNQTILKTAAGLQKDKLEPFYQEETGRFIFLHELSRKYLIDFQSTGKPVKTSIIEKEETWYGDRMPEYKHLSHLNPSVEIDLAIVNISDFVSETENGKFLKELKEYMRKREEIEKKEQAEAEILNKRYEENQKYIQKLKDLQTREFQIRVPTELDPCDINEHSFPSLISEQSSLDQKEDHRNSFDEPKQLSKKKTHEPNRNFEQEFPELISLKNNKSEKPVEKNEGGKRGRKKKDKKVDMTHLLFANRQDEYD